MQRVCILHGSGHQKEQIPIRVSAFFARWRFEESNATGCLFYVDLGSLLEGAVTAR